MAGKFITQIQQQRVAEVLTGLVAQLDMRGMQWTREHREGIEIAYSALGAPCPFRFTNVPPEPAATEPEQA
ncbi:hypothetical protein [Solimonas marina]|uniref:Uncharacterized protein n=1 Tax=Solimonas marina TaxID=2714601 RepID=A0A969W8Q4_9GAMM|nr:hypothetical protein [Solimonas marina]NKF21595.1 hypothetical protein [Solimonas marina]